MLRWRIGNVTVTSVLESESATIGEILLPEVDGAALRSIEWLPSRCVDEQGCMVLAIQSFLVESCGRKILVDTCVGNDKERPLPEWHLRSGPYLDRLREAGAERESVDLVLCTHLHIDHVGWNTMLMDDAWVPTFPAARYLFGREEWDHWKDQPEEFGPVISDSVRPIVDAGLADLVETDHRLTDEINLEPTPGHTPGHVSVRIKSQGEEAVISGDIMHHPSQIAHPDWSVTLDHDKDMSARSRRGVLESCADKEVLLIGSHFVAPTAGHVVRDGDAYRWQC